MTLILIMVDLYNVYTCSFNDRTNGFDTIVELYMRQATNFSGHILYTGSIVNLGEDQMLVELSIIYLLLSQFTLIVNLKV